MPRLKSIVAVAALALLGCGGSSSPSHASHVRFFNGFTNLTGNANDVRVYVGGTLLNSNGVGPVFSYGSPFDYAKAPSGTVTINVDPYSSLTTVYATLASQTLVEGGNYTVLGLNANGTRTLKLFADSVANPSSGTGYYRILDASPTHSPIYVTLTDPDGNLVYQTSTNGGLTIGGSTGYQADSVSGSATYVLRAYSSSDLSTEILSATNVTLREDAPLTVVLFDNPDNTGRIVVRTGYDVFNGE